MAGPTTVTGAEWAESPYPGGPVGSMASDWERFPVAVAPMTVPFWWARRFGANVWKLCFPEPRGLVVDPRNVVIAPTRGMLGAAWFCDVLWSGPVTFPTQGPPQLVNGTGSYAGLPNRYYGAAMLGPDSVRQLAEEVSRALVREAMARREVRP